MSEEAETVSIDLNAWVESAKANPVLYLQRQVTEIVLTAIGLSRTLSDTLVLKGGALMALAFKSDRATGDVDFSAASLPGDLPDQIKDDFNAVIPKSMRELGYLDILCQVQRVKKKPRPQNFKELDFPALDISVGYARKGTPQVRGFERGQSSQILKMEVSFKDQIYQFQNLHLEDAHVCVKAFSLNELVAEKLRALIQQKAEHRNRYRRQDVFDLWFLLENHANDINHGKVLSIFLEKSRTREIFPDITSLDKEVHDRAKAEWESISLEIGKVPDFEDCFSTVTRFYGSLPWDEK